MNDREEEPVIDYLKSWQGMFMISICAIVIVLLSFAPASTCSISSDISSTTTTGVHPK